MLLYIYIVIPTIVIVHKNSIVTAPPFSRSDLRKAELGGDAFDGVHQVFRTAFAMEARGRGGCPFANGG
jgi:hypothetical protein